MIINFGSKETESIWIGDQVKKWPVNFQVIARRKLRMLNNSQNLADLRIPPANRLEKLSGNLKNYFSIRINNQWRIIFKWNNGNASDVEIIDYH
jgi:proteic killer suppression protein